MVSIFAKKFLMKFLLNFRLPPNKTFIVPTVFGFAYGACCILILAMGFMQSNNVVYLVAFLAISLGVNSLRVTDKIITSVNVNFPEYIFGPANEESDYYIQILSHHEVAKMSFEISCKDKTQMIQRGMTLVDSPKIEEGVNKDWILKISTTAPFGLSRAWKLIPINSKIIGFPLPIGRSLNESFSYQSESPFEGEIKPLKAGESFQRIIWRILAKNGKKVRWSEAIDSSKNHLIFDYDLIESKSHLEKLRQLSRWILEANEAKIPFVLKYGEFRFRRGEDKLSVENILLKLSEWGFSREN